MENTAVVIEQFSVSYPGNERFDLIESNSTQKLHDDQESLDFTPAVHTRFTC